MNRQASTFTCCWTDHSNGCPQDDISGQKFESTLDWLRAYHGAHVKRGYEQQKTDAELERQAATLDRWKAEWEGQPRGVI